MSENFKHIYSRMYTNRLSSLHIHCLYNKDNKEGISVWLLHKVIIRKFACQKSVDQILNISIQIIIYYVKRK